MGTVVTDVGFSVGTAGEKTQNSDGFKFRARSIRESEGNKTAVTLCSHRNNFTKRPGAEFILR